jgi:hypothetical protein
MGRFILTIQFVANLIFERWDLATCLHSPTTIIPKIALRKPKGGGLEIHSSLPYPHDQTQNRHEPSSDILGECVSLLFEEVDSIGASIVATIIAKVFEPVALRG